MIFVGIDPGATGAIAFLSEDGGLLSIQDMPVDEIQVGKKNRRVVSSAGFCALLVSVVHKLTGHTVLTGNINVTLEKLIAMPAFDMTTGRRSRQPSAASMGTFFEGGGIIRGACAMAGVSVNVVHAATWKAGVGCPTGKDGARARAAQLWPTWSTTFGLKKDHNRAEAALIGRYGCILQRKLMS